MTSVLVQITIENVGVSRQGYGMPLILSHNASFGSRIRFYTGVSGVADDFATDSPEYIAATAFFSQTPKPPMIAIGRAGGLVTQKYELEVDEIQNLEEYTLTVAGEGFTTTDVTYTALASATAEAIHVGLVTGLNAIVDKTFTAAYAPLVVADTVFTASFATGLNTDVAHGLKTGDGPFQLTGADLALPLATVTDYWAIRVSDDTYKLATSLANAVAGTAIVLVDDGSGTQTLTDKTTTVRPSDPFTVTADATGNWFSIEINTLAQMNCAQTHAVPTGATLAADLTAILTASTLWYQVHTLYNSKAYCAAVAAWTEANGRTYVFDTVDTDVIKVAYSVGVTTDVGSTLFESGYSTVMGAYHPSPVEMLSEAWMGRWLPTTPGSSTAKFKTLVGPGVTSLSDTHIVNLTARRMNFYGREFNRSITKEGTVFSETYKFLDVRRDVDWLIDLVQTNVFGTLADAEKVPYTRAGIVRVQGSLLGSMDEASAAGVFDIGSTSVEMPLLEDVPTIDKSDRILRNAKFSGTLAGAIHAAIPVAGVVRF